MARVTLPRRTAEARALVKEIIVLIEKHPRRRPKRMGREQMLFFIYVFIPKLVSEVLKELGAQASPRKCRDACARAGHAIDEIFCLGWTPDRCAEARAARADLPSYLDAFLYGAQSKFGRAFGVDITRADILRWLGQPPRPGSSRWLANLAPALGGIGRLGVPRGRSFEPSKFAVALVVHAFLERALGGKVPSTTDGLFWVITQHMYELLFGKSAGSVQRVCDAIIRDCRTMTAVPAAPATSF